MVGLPSHRYGCALFAGLLVLASCEGRPPLPDPDPGEFGLSDTEDTDSEGPGTEGDPLPDLGDGGDTNEPEECFSVVDSLLIDDNTHPESVSCVEHVLGDLVIGPTTQLLDLSMLASLREVDGSLFIGGNLSLTSLAGLDSLEEVGWLQLRRNHNLSNLTGLDALTRVDRLTISNNEGMTNLVGLPTGLAPALLQVDKNDLLQTLDGLPEFMPPSDGQALHVEVRENPSLIQLGGLSECCANQAISLVVADNDKLSDLGGLESFTVMTSLELYDNYGIEDFDGLDQLSAVGTLLVDYDHCTWLEQPKLHDFNGAESLSSIDVLHVEWAAQLVSLEGLEGVTSLDKLLLYNNASLPQTEVEAFVAQVPPTTFSDVCGTLGGDECSNEMCPMF